MCRVGSTRSWPKCEREVGALSNWQRSSAPVEGAPLGRRRREARGGGGVIAKVTRGQRPSGAVRYLFGPGRYNEHEDAHVVAASASLRVVAGLRPTNPELEELAAAIDLPAVLFG